MRSGKTRIEHFGRATLAVAIVSCMPGWQVLAQSTQAADTQSTFNIPAGSLAAALDQFSAQTGIQTAGPPEQLVGKQVGALVGEMTWREALDRLLRGSGLEYRQVNASTVVIRPSGSPPKPSAPAATRSSSKTGASAKRTVTDMQAVTVTGSRIRGGTTPSPVITIGAEDMQEEGFSDLGEVIRSVSENFRGGQNPGVTLGASNGAGGLANNNVTGGAGLNLRGLGPDASLTLLNGRRLAYGGFSQAVDISAIPVEAVDRVEIVADGASAIYGSDAVGGVGNVILKQDFEGLELGARYGSSEDGGLTTREYSATAGTVWSSGGLIATYEYATNDPIFASQRRYTASMPNPTTIYPGSDLRSGLFSIHQSLGDAVELHLDALRTERDQESYRYLSTTAVRYNRITPETTETFLAPSIDIQLPKDWMLSFSSAWGKDTYADNEIQIEPSPSALVTDTCYCNHSRTYGADAEGPLFNTAAGDTRLAVGVGYRENEYVQNDRLADTIAIQGSESSRFVYAELNVPLVGPDEKIPGVQRLDVTAAIRTEKYDTFGRATTPKLGLIYGPTADITLKASWGRSFKAPTLFQLYQARQAVLLDTSLFGDPNAPKGTALISGGGNPNLDPERARTWTTSLGFHPEAMPGLDAELTLFHIDYTDRVEQPINDYSIVFNNPLYAPFVDQSPTPEKQAEIITGAQFYNYTGAAYDPSKVIALLYTSYANVARQKIKGVDLSGSYRFSAGANHLEIRGSASWLDSTQQNLPGQAESDLAGTLYSPAKINSRLGGVWIRGGFTASLFANYTSGVTNPADGRKTASFTTFDAVLRYATKAQSGAWSGWVFSLSVDNLLDRAPPLNKTSAPIYTPYDSTNYSAIGRFANLSITKRW